MLRSFIIILTKPFTFNKHQTNHTLTFDQNFESSTHPQQKLAHTYAREQSIVEHTYEIPYGLLAVDFGNDCSDVLSCGVEH